MQEQAYLKGCKCKNGGIVIRKDTPCCRWCLTPYNKGSYMTYDDDKSQNEESIPITAPTPAPTKDYEILSFLDNYSHVVKWGSQKNMTYTEWIKGCIDFNYNIYSVKRLNDRETFTVGDKVNYGIIGNFYVSGNEVKVHLTNNCGATLASIEHKEKNKLLTTSDGVAIYEGDTVWFVNENFKAHSFYIGEGVELFEDYNKYFSTEEKANEYVLQNKRVLSFSDVTNNLWSMSQIDKNLLEGIAKARINVQ